jgi:hypothetical protein
MLQYNEELSQQWCPLWRAEQCAIYGPSDNNRRFHRKFWISLGIRTVADNVTVKETDVTNKTFDHAEQFTWACLSRLKSFGGFFLTMKSTANITQRRSQMNEALVEWFWHGKTKVL